MDNISMTSFRLEHEKLAAKKLSLKKLKNSLSNALYGKAPSVSKKERLAIKTLSTLAGGGIGNISGRRANKKIIEKAFKDHGVKVDKYKSKMKDFDAKFPPVTKDGKPLRYQTGSEAFIHGLLGLYGAPLAITLDLMTLGGTGITKRSLNAIEKGSTRFSGQKVRKGLSKGYIGPKKPGKYREPHPGKHISRAITGGVLGNLAGDKLIKALGSSRKAKYLKRKRNVNIGIGAGGAGGLAALLAGTSKSKKGKK